VGIRCRRSPLRLACPSVIPRVPHRPGAGLLGGLVVTGPHRVNQFWGLDLEHGAPNDHNPQRNQPPTVLHMTILAGDVSELLGGMAYPDTRRDAALRDGIAARKRLKPLLFGSADWGCRRGALFLAPSYPFGGEIGGHLTFWWRSNSTNYLISLHAWEPLTQCERVLRRVVLSTP
jgi:hypothetical protein